MPKKLNVTANNIEITSEETNVTATVPNTEEMVEKPSDEQPLPTVDDDGEERLLNFIIRAEVSHSE